MLKLGFCPFTFRFGFSFPLPDEMPPIRSTNSERLSSVGKLQNRTQTARVKWLLIPMIKRNQ